MTGQPAKRLKTFSGMLTPTLHNFAGWLFLYLVSFFFYASFGFQLSTALQDPHGKAGLLAMAAAIVTYTGWIPLVIILVRALMGQENTETPDGE
ncbi:hypothetical protein HJ526_04050 [Donghicola sp. C2-DW-16]|uniref:DUF485 domain-containing protein n=1 Tax=Donghicola mangrovi TaxID=2729614 RepID=A0ABX2PCL9_9RHOB|nr:hypothetical protein [Donghicola mangrovi]NVO26582.1 hypothetical protein [Donghicola mangrovi]